MAKKKSYGKTASGKTMSDELAKELAEEAEAGYDVEGDAAAPSRAPGARLGAGERRVGSPAAGAARRAGQAGEAGRRDDLIGDPQGALRQYLKVG
jgi:hypothetical protein